MPESDSRTPSAERSELPRDASAVSAVTPHEKPEKKSNAALYFIAFLSFFVAVFAGLPAVARLVEFEVGRNINDLITRGCWLIQGVLAIWQLWRRIDFRAVIVNLGILGTFIGIVIGLGAVETSESALFFTDEHGVEWFRSSLMVKSIAGLIEGMKTAFYTSISGLGLYCLLSVIERVRERGDEEE